MLSPALHLPYPDLYHVKPPYLTDVLRSLREGTHDKAPNMLNTDETVQCVVPHDYKQILDEVFVISRIIKVEASVISQAEGRGG